MDLVSKNILVLEDDDMNYRLIELFLKGHKLFRARFAHEALKLIEEHDEFDLYILDIFLKESRFNGLDIIKLLDSNSKILIYTALDIGYVIQNKYSNYAYLQKPVTQKEFRKCIEDIFQQNK